MNIIYQMAPAAQTTGEYLAAAPITLLIAYGILRSKFSR